MSKSFSRKKTKSMMGHACNRAGRERVKKFKKKIRHTDYSSHPLSNLIYKCSIAIFLFLGIGVVRTFKC